MEKYRAIHPFWILLMCIVMNMCIFFITYRMIIEQNNQFKEFTFSHRNAPLVCHPLSEKLLIRLEQLEEEHETLKKAVTPCLSY